MVKTPVPVDFAHDSFPLCQGAGAAVHHHAVLFMDIQYPDGSQDPQIRRLSAALREKGGLIQDYLPDLTRRLAGQNLGGKGLNKRILIIEFFRFHGKLLSF